MAHVVVVTGKDKLRSNTLLFTFVPNGAHPVATGMLYQQPLRSPGECITQSSRLSPSYSPQPPTPSSGSVGCFTLDSPFYPATPPANIFEGILDVCAQQLDQQAEEEILSIAVLPLDSNPLVMDELNEKEELPIVLSPGVSTSFDKKLDKENVTPPTIVLPEDSSSQPFHFNLNIII